MLVSDCGGSQSVSNVNLTFDDAAANSLGTGRITSGTYKPTNRNPSGDLDAFPAPAPSSPYGTALSGFNATSPNGTWKLYVLDEFTSGTGSISNGWAINIITQPAAPLVSTSAVTNITSTTAILHGTVNPLGLTTNWSFNFGTTTAYGDTQPAQNAGSGTTAVPVALNLVGLMPGTTYHCQLSAQNSVGTTNSTDAMFTTTAFVDSDHDGIPDDYEIANGMNPNNPSDAALDSNGDGYTNLQEYLAGTDPRSATNALRITAITRTGDDFDITFTTVLGKRYRVESTVNLAGGTWIILEDNVHGTGDEVTITDFNVGDLGPNHFYHVQIIP